jgi:hypothetical protein
VIQLQVFTKKYRIYPIEVFRLSDYFLRKSNFKEARVFHSKGGMKDETYKEHCNGSVGNMFSLLSDRRPGRGSAAETKHHHDYGR